MKKTVYLDKLINIPLIYRFTDVITYVGCWDCARIEYKVTRMFSQHPKGVIMLVSLLRLLTTPRCLLLAVVISNKQRFER